MVRKGQCLCGDVKFTASNAGDDVGACHCGSCRRWGGGPFLEINCGDAVEFEGEENISIFSSSDWAERGFCSRCGTNLFYRLKEGNAHMIAVGTFTDDEALKLTTQVFVDERPDYYEFANETENMTGAELFAKFAPGK